MALSPAQLEAANKLFQRGLNVDGTPLSEQQKQSVAGLQAKGLDPAQTLLMEPQPQAGALKRFGAGAATPLLNVLQTIQQSAAPLQQAGFPKPLLQALALKQRMPQPTGIAGGLGQVAGFIPLAAAPETAARAVPAALGRGIPRILARTAGGAGLGMATSPEHPVLGGAVMGGLSSGLSLAPPIARELFGSKTAENLLNLRLMK